MGSKLASFMQVAHLSGIGATSVPAGAARLRSALEETEPACRSAVLGLPWGSACQSLKHLFRKAVSESLRLQSKRGVFQKQVQIARSR